MADKNKTSHMTEEGLSYLLESDVVKFDPEVLGFDPAELAKNENGLFEIAVDVEDIPESSFIIELEENELMAILRACHTMGLSLEQFMINAIDDHVEKLGDKA